MSGVDWMALRPPALVFLGVVALVVALKAMGRKGWVDFSGRRTGRGVGRAMTGLQELIEPAAAHVITVENRESVVRDQGQSAPPENEADPVDLDRARGV